MKLGAIVLSAGSGTRYGSKKQFETLHDVPLWKIVSDKVKTVVPSENVVIVGIDIAGGNTRSESVRIGLNALDYDTDRVVILEAARPLVTEKQIVELLEDGNPSVSFVMPLVNTVIYRDGTYINRNELYELLTPQAFDYAMLTKAYSQYEQPDFTDETRLMFETYAIKPTFIETTQNLHKVTYKRDISILLEIEKMMQEGLI